MISSTIDKIQENENNNFNNNNNINNDKNLININSNNIINNEIKETNENKEIKEETTETINNNTTDNNEIKNNTVNSTSKIIQNFDDIPIKTGSSNFMDLLEKNLEFEKNIPQQNSENKTIRKFVPNRVKKQIEISKPQKGEIKKYK